MTPKIAHFLKETRPATPCLVIDLDVVNERYRRLQDSLPGVVISYAVKANPARPVLEILNAGGSHFDAASIYEIEDLLALGVTADRIVYGNTIKKESDIAAAYAHGVRLFAFDSEAEVEKLARSAPGAGVYCRIITTCEGADWPLSRKFGCELDMAHDLLLKARELGLDAQGLSFHVGSQQTNPRQWGHAIKRAAQVFRSLADQGLQLRMLNLGGGFPVRYRKEVPEIEEVAAAIMEAMRHEFGDALPRMFIEPGRIITADAGIIQTEVVLISTKNYDNGVRWVYLDVGKFGGLAETMDEAIQYPLVTRYNGAPSGPVVIAGPTCDGADILYEKADYSLPLDLKVGDTIQIGGAGAYTTTYASICFNGFPPLQAHYI